MNRSQMPQRKTPLARTGGLTRGGRINPYSKRRRNRDAAYAAMREQVYEEQDGFCAYEDGGLLCGNAMTDVHHIAGRGGRDPHRRSNLVGLCRWHHNFVHANPAAARELGLMASRHTRKRAA